jgi:hypothetical protein
MNKFIFSIIFSIFLIAFTASDVFACDCILLDEIPVEKQLKNAYASSTSIFVGEVVEVITKPDVYFVSVKFKVEKNWNKNFQKEITVSTGKGGGDCGYKFQIGKKYLVYAYGENNKLSTDICTRTALANSNKDAAFLNKIKKPKIKSAPK